MCKYLAIVLLCSVLHHAYADECKRTGDCSCEFYDGTGIDLKPMLPDGAQPMYANETSDIVYYFNPCKDIPLTPWTDNTIKNECKDGYTLCKINTTDHSTIRLGDLKKTQFTTGEGLSLTYIMSNQSETHVKLVCTRDKKSYFFTDSSTATTTHLLLFTPYACPYMMEDFSKPSTGTVLLIMFFIVAVSYFAIGTTVNAMYLGARGIEMVPHLDFWRNLPGLVRDGAQFLRNGCTVREQAPRSEEYDAI